LGKNKIDNILFLGSGETLLVCIDYLNSKTFLPQKIIYINKKNDLTKIPPYLNKLMLFKSKNEFLNNIDDYSEHLVVSISLPFKIPGKKLKIFKPGVINVHSSLLPDYRGIHPLNWSIINGERFTGVTIHWMDDNFDTGPIIIQKKFQINFDDDINMLRKKTDHLSATMVCELLKKYIYSGKISSGLPQNNQKNFKYAHKRTFQDSLLNLDNKTVIEIYNFCRALYKPYPNAFINQLENKYYINKVCDLVLMTQKSHYYFETLMNYDYKSNIKIINNKYLIIKALDGFLICEYLLNNE